MSRYDFQIPLTFKHRIVFSRDVFGDGLSDLAGLFADAEGEKRGLVLIEESVARAWPGLESGAREGLRSIGFEIAGLAVLPGGERVKADDALVREVWRLIDAAHLDRQIGRTLDLLIEQPFVGRTPDFAPVRFDNDAATGSVVQMTIIAAQADHLTAHRAS